jgi:hypothetical protein
MPSSSSTVYPTRSAIRWLARTMRLSFDVHIIATLERSKSAWKRASRSLRIAFSDFRPAV